MIDYGHELGHGDAAFLRAHSHCKLVTKVPASGLAHPGNAQMLPETCGHLNIKLIERDNPVDYLRTCKIADRICHFGAIVEISHQKDFINYFAGPLRLRRAFRPSTAGHASLYVEPRGKTRAP